MTRGRRGALAALISFALIGAAAPGADASQRLLQLPGTAGCIVPTGISGCTTQALNNPWDVVIAGNQVYVSDLGNDLIRIYDRDSLSGALTPRPTSTTGCIAEDSNASGGCRDGRGLDGASELALSPDGTRIYVVSVVGQALATLDRDPATGNLTQAANTAGCVSASGNGGECTQVSAISGLDGVAVSPNGQDVYIVGDHAGGNNGFIFLFDVVSGAGSGVAQHPPILGGCVEHTLVTTNCSVARGLNGARRVAVSPDGENVYVTSATANVITILTRASDGSLGAIAGTGGCLAQTAEGEGCTESDNVGQEINGIVFASDSRGWFTGIGTGSVTTINRNTSTGALSVGPCASSSTNGATASCADLPNNEFGLTDLALTPDRSVLIVAGRFGRGLTTFELGADGTPNMSPAPLGCLATGGISFTTTCTIPRGFARDAASNDKDFGPPGVALSSDGKFVYAPSQGAAEDAPGIVVASLDTTDPVCQNATVEMTSGQQAGLPVSCGDADSDPLTVSVISAPAAGVLGQVDQGTQTVPYAAPQVSSDLTQALTFKAVAGNGRESAPATVTINVHPPAAPSPGGGGTPPPSGGTTLLTLTPKVAAKFKLIKKLTLVKSLVIKAIASGAKVSISCKGKGCPFKSKSFKPKAGKVDATKALKKAKLKKGAVLSIRITKSGAIGKLFSYKANGKKAPKAVVKCLPPGGKAAAC